MEEAKFENDGQLLHGQYLLVAYVPCLIGFTPNEKPVKETRFLSLVKLCYASEAWQDFAKVLPSQHQSDFSPLAYQNLDSLPVPCLL